MNIEGLVILNNVCDYLNKRTFEVIYQTQQDHNDYNDAFWIVAKIRREMLTK